MRHLNTYGVCFLWLSGSSVAAPAATLRVDPAGAGDFTEIQPALDSAGAGDIVLVAAGEYVIARSLEFNRFHVFHDPESPPVVDLTLRSERGPEVTTIRLVGPPDEHGFPPGPVVFISRGETERTVLDGFTITGGPPGTVGVGVYSDGSNATIVNCVIHSTAGVGVILGDDVTMTGCVVTSNLGGGIHCNAAGEADIVGCTFIGNGGNPGVPAIYVDDGATARITNCLIVGNGLGVYCGEDSHSTTIVRNSTIAANLGAGFLIDQEALLILENSVVWDNGAGPIIPDDISSGFWVAPQVSFSCLDGDQVWPGEANIREDPRFVSPGEFDFTRFLDTGVPDYIVDRGNWRLQPNSTCIDTGMSEGAPTFDIEGNERPCGAGVDMGAYEYRTPECRGPDAEFKRGDANADNNTDLSDAVFTLNYLFLGGTAPSCEDSADADDNGSLEITDAVYLLNYLFLGGPSPDDPFPTCAPDPTIDELTCESFESCEAP